MSRPADGKVGEAVYRNHSPVQAGRIVSIVHPVGEPLMTHGVTRPRVFSTVRVKWINGTETEETDEILQSLTALVDETSKKLATHTATLKKVMETSVS